MPLKIEAARVGGVEIPNQKYIEYSLQYIYGIGPTTAKAILADTVSWRGRGRGRGRGRIPPEHCCLGLLRAPERRGPYRCRRPRADPPRDAPLAAPAQAIENRRTRELSEEDLTRLREEVDKYTTEGDLRRFNALNIKRFKEIGCYRGRRHINVRRGRWRGGWLRSGCQREEGAS